MRAPARRSLAFAVVFIAAALGCTQIIGLDGPYKEGPSTATGSTSTGMTGPCSDGDTMQCYTGDPATQDKGICKSGVATCADGKWGECVGEGAPTTETCNGDDDDCDGVVDNGCPCIGGMCTGALEWAKSFGGSGDDRFWAMSSDPSNNLLLSGSFGGSLNLGGNTFMSTGVADAWIMKLEPSGNPIWSKSFSGPGLDSARAIVSDSAGNVFVLGVFQGPVSFGGAALTGPANSLFVVKLDAKGQHIWSKAFTGATNFGYAKAAVDASGDLLFTTVMDGNASFGGATLMGMSEIIAVVKLDGAGNHLWSKGFATGACCGVNSTSIAVDADGNVAIAGDFNGAVDFGGGLFTANAGDIFVAELSAAGDHLWSYQGSTAADEAATAVAFDPDGNVIVGGNLNSANMTLGGLSFEHFGYSDIFIAKFTSKGAPLWGKTLGQGGGTENCTGLKVDGRGNVVITGSTDTSGLDLGGGPLSAAGLLLAKYDAAGNHLWSKAFSATCCNDLPAPALTIDALAYPSIAAMYKVNVDLGSGTLTPVVAPDVLVGRFAP